MSLADTSVFRRSEITHSMLKPARVVNCSWGFVFSFPTMQKSPKYLWLFFALALLLVLSALSSPVWYDDAGHYLVAREGAAHGELCYPIDVGADICDPTSPYITMGPAPAWMLVGWMKVLGTQMNSSRMLFVLFSIGLLALLFQMIRSHFSLAKAAWMIGLFGVNIQFLTYGAEVLGEIPMLLGAWGAIACWLQFGKKEELHWGVLTAGFLAFGLLSKAYLLIPLGLGMLGWITLLVFQGLWRKVGQSVFWWGIGLVIAILLQWLSWGEWGSRGSYTSEFFTFDILEALRYLAYKPLFWLGTVALGLRLYFHRQPQDSLFAMVHLGWVLFFLASAGYDRFGFQLLIVPAIYLAEFVTGLWKRWKGRWGLRLGMALLMVLLFAQKSPYLIGMRLLNPENVNANEKALAGFLVEDGAKAVFTYDQQLVPFLSPGIKVRLPEIVPSNSENCNPLALRPGEYLLAGPYARTEFQNCIPWEELELIADIFDGETRYEVLQRP